MDLNKYCIKCKKDHSVFKFGQHKRVLASGEVKIYNGNICNTCVNLANIARRTPEQKKCWSDNKRKVRQDRKKRAVEYKGGVCEHCKQVYHIAAFDFHHINPDEKDMDPGLMMQSRDEILFKEIDKCILLCANCHRIHHYEEGTLGKIKVRKKEVQFNNSKY